MFTLQKILHRCFGDWNQVGNYEWLFKSKYRPGSLMRYFFKDGTGFDRMRMADGLKQREVGVVIAVGVGFS
jgi:hypothetical protein